MKRCQKCGLFKPLNQFYRHPSTRDRLRSSCIACIAEEYQNDKEQKKARARVNGPRWRAENKQAIKEWHAENYRRNKDIILPRTKAWQAANKKLVAKNNSEWKRANLDKICEYNNRRRAAKIAAGGSHTTLEARYLLIWQGYICANPYCCADLRIVKKHLDHKTPLVRGGSNGAENLQWLCQPCNLSKAKLTNEEWLALQEVRAAA